MQSSASGLKDVLELLYDRYNRRACIEPDPLAFVWRYAHPADREIVGLLSALLAYGRVAQIHKSLETLLAILGPYPSQSVRSLDAAVKRKLAPFRHRFNSGADIVQLLTTIRELLNEYGSLEKVFHEGVNEKDTSILEGVRHFHKVFWDRFERLHSGPPSAPMKFLLSNPDSAGKRMHLFLRWMVRRDRVDPGVWTRMAPAQLLMPVDTHILRLTRILGFHTAQTASLRTVCRITEHFARICPADPVKYDFALSRIGILENCTGRPKPQCEQCELLFYCRR
ncbi:MAG: TIGR02757 family protein [Planctomycetaceae bacterium]|nr:TIGR02757 family protein [Planctomycetaceae bacterium]